MENSYHSHLAPFEFFSMGLGTMLELGYLVYKEMTRDGGKSNVAKRNLIDGI